MHIDDSGFFSRRDFLVGAGALGATSLALWTGGCDSCAQQIKNRPTRRNISNLAANDPIINSFKAAVQAMKALPASDLRNWTKQANIHFTSCPHSNWFFLPWHRAYLLYFERICRKLANDDSFALPYWNWTTHPAVPDVFWDQASPLYDGTRQITQADQADPSWVGAPVIESILAEPSFILFASDKPQGSQFHFPGGAGTGMLEGTPHNNIHNWVGGDMSQFTSPLDAVFWTHHNILDCLWVEWNINRGNANTNDPTWTDRQFTDFVDEDGNPVTISVATTVLLPFFTYQFEPCAPGQGQAQAKMERAQLERFLRAGAPAKLELLQRFELARAFSAEVNGAAAGAIKIEPGAFRGVLDAASRNRAVLTVAGVELPEKNDFFVRVFVDKADASAQTPIDDPHYAGSFSLFFDLAAAKSHGEMPKPGFLIDVTPTLRKLSQAGSLPAETAITLVPIPYAHRPAAGRLALERLELGIARY
jgi:tyrosinase